MRAAPMPDAFYQQVTSNVGIVRMAAPQPRWTAPCGSTAAPSGARGGAT